MGTGKKTTGKKTTKKSDKENPEKKLLEERLNQTGPFVLRDFCSQHGMENSKKAAKGKLISFLLGKFKDGELSINDLYPEEDPENVDVDDDDDGDEEETPKAKKAKKGKKAPAKKRSSKKSKPKDDDDDDDDDNDDDDDDLDGEEDDNVDDDDLGDDDDDDDNNCSDDDDDDDDDLGDEDDDELVKPKGKSKGKGKKSVSGVEDKVDKLMDLSTKLAGALEEVYKMQVEQKAFNKLATAYLMKQSGVDKAKVSKLVKKWTEKAKKEAGADDQEDE